MPTLRLYLIFLCLIAPEIANAQTGGNETLNSLDRHGLSFSTTMPTSSPAPAALLIHPLSTPPITSTSRVRSISAIFRFA